jgi:hypothetical protein
VPSYFEIIGSSARATAGGVVNTAVGAKNMVVRGAVGAKDLVVDGAIGAKDGVVWGANSAKAAIARKSEDIKAGTLNRLAQKQSDGLKAGQALMTPEERQHGYDVARKSMLGELSSLPKSATQQCITSAKAQRRKERMELVNTALESCPDCLVEAQRLRGNMDEVENMRCAKHVYIANDQNVPAELRDNPPPGFIKATEAQLESMQLSQDMLTPEGSQFRAAVYMKDPAVWGPNPDPAAVITFRGSTPDKEDWDNNFAQGVDREAPYYKRAVEIGNRLAASRSKVRIVGHSLGGGLASAAQGGSGLDASTYNAAGLHPNTVARYSQDREHLQAEAPRIAAFRIEGEVLTKTQESLWGSKGVSAVSHGAVGIKHDLKPAHDRRYFEENDKIRANKDDNYEGYLHGMDQVIAATEKQKETDENALKGCLAK